VDGQAECLGQPGRLAADAAVAPQADHLAANLLLEGSSAIPVSRLLIAKHAGQIADQVDHHRQNPFGDGRVVEAAGVAEAQRALGESEIS